MVPCPAAEISLSSTTCVIPSPPRGTCCQHRALAHTALCTSCLQASDLLPIERRIVCKICLHCTCHNAINLITGGCAYVTHASACLWCNRHSGSHGVGCTPLLANGAALPATDTASRE